MSNSLSDKIPVIAVIGPTASGKTAVSVELAKIYNAEIISADSMQIYKGMDIASAKPTEDEKQGIVHHLMDFLPSDEKYSVARYCTDAGEKAEDIRTRNKNIIVCGGTGLYIDSFLGNISFEEQPDNAEVRNKLKKRLEQEGIGVLFDELRQIDPETAESLHINNEGRILRAIETYILTGEKPSVLRERSREKPSPYETVYIFLNYENRDILYDRINKRVDIMLERGLKEEAREYFSLDGSYTSSQAIGHKELIPYLKGEMSLDDATENLKRATRNYAKRQLTWFRRNKEAHTVFCDRYNSFDEIISEITSIIDKTKLFGRGDEY